MARTRDLAPYPSPSPKLYDEEVPKLEDQDLRDGYDKQFRINQRLKRWGIVIADIINALDIGGWDPSTKVVWIGDGEDADYTSIAEGLLSISPSSYDPRILIVFPGVYFDRLYIPAHTSIYGLGQRGMVKIWMDANNDETMIEGGNQNIHLANLDIQQRVASATGTKVIDLSATDVSFDNVYVENRATDADSEVVIINNSSLTAGKNVLLNNVHIKGNNASVHSRVTTRLDTATVFDDVWPFNDYFETWPGNIHCKNLAEDVGGFTFNANSFRAANATSPFGDNSLEFYGNNGDDQGSSGEVLGGGVGDAATAVSLTTWVRYNDFSFDGAGNMADSEYQDIMSIANIGANFTGLHLALHWDTKRFVAIHGSTNYITDCIYAQSDKHPSPKVWYRLDAAYNRVNGDLMLWVDGMLVGYANKPKPYVYAGNSQSIRMALHMNGNINTALCDLMRFSEVAAANGWVNPWEFVSGGKQDISTLRLSSKNDEGTRQGNVRLNNVLVENDTPNNNIIIGDVPFECHGVVSKLAQGNNESKNIAVRNDTDNNQVHIFGSVASLYGEYSLVFDNVRSRVSTSRGGFHANRPVHTPPAENAFFDEDWTQRPSEGQLSAHEFFTGNFIDDINLLYHGELDAGHLMQRAPTQWFDNVGVDGNLQVTGDITIDGDVDLGGNWPYIGEYDPTNAYDHDHFVMPQKDLDTLLTFSGNDKDRYIHFVSDAYIKWNESGDHFYFPKDVGIGTDSPTFKFQIESAADDMVKILSSRNVAAAMFVELHHNRGVGNVVDEDNLYLFYALSDSDTTVDAITSCVKHIAVDVTHAIKRAAIGLFTDTISGSGERLRIDRSELDLSVDSIYLRKQDGSALANDDGFIFFASDAYIKWDESEDHFDIAKPVKNLTIERDAIAERGLVETPGYVQHDDWDIEGFRYPYTHKKDEGGGFVADLVTKTGNYTATASNHTIICNATGGSFTITLPAAASHAGGVYYIKKIDSSANTITVDGNGSETIDDAITAVLTTQYESITIQSDGSEWWII